jgi:hypothetical protein
MDLVDKKKVQKVVYDMSKGSRYFNNEKRKEGEVLQRIQRMSEAAATLTEAQLAEHKKVSFFASLTVPKFPVLFVFLDISIESASTELFEINCNFTLNSC